MKVLFCDYAITTLEFFIYRKYVSSIWRYV